jgi:hypothetical protein
MSAAVAVAGMATVQSRPSFVTQFGSHVGAEAPRIE